MIDIELPQQSREQMSICHLTSSQYGVPCIVPATSAGISGLAVCYEYYGPHGNPHDVWYEYRYPTAFVMAQGGLEMAIALDILSEEEKKHANR